MSRLESTYLETSHREIWCRGTTSALTQTVQRTLATEMAFSSLPTAQSGEQLLGHATSYPATIQTELTSETPKPAFWCRETISAPISTARLSWAILMMASPLMV